MSKGPPQVFGSGHLVVLENCYRLLSLQFGNEAVLKRSPAVPKTEQDVLKSEHHAIREGVSKGMLLSQFLVTSDFPTARPESEQWPRIRR